MNKTMSFTFLLTFFCFFSSQSQLMASGFTISGNPNSPPVSWEENGKILGFGPDLATSILTVLDIKAHIVPHGSWSDVQKATQAGDIDMLVSAYRNKERDSYLLFTEPYLSQPVVIIVKKGEEFQFTNWDTLIGKKGASNSGESYGDAFDNYLRQNLDVSFLPVERAIELLSRSEIDYLIADLYTALIYSRLLQGEKAITILEPAVTVQDFHFAVNRDSALASFIPKINQKIADKTKSGEIENLLLLNFGKWQKIIGRNSALIGAESIKLSREQQNYRENQDEMARQRVLKTMVNREGLPKSVQ